MHLLYTCAYTFTCINAFSHDSIVGIHPCWKKKPGVINTSFRCIRVYTFVIITLVKNIGTPSAIMS